MRLVLVLLPIFALAQIGPFDGKEFHGRIGFFGHTHREAIYSEEGGPPLEQFGERAWKLPENAPIATG